MIQCLKIKDRYPYLFTLGGSLATMFCLQKVEAMRVLIQNSTSFLFLQSGGGWTANAEEALDFERSLRAMKYIKGIRLEHVQIVLRFNRPTEDVILAGGVPKLANHPHPLKR
jgi:hypothetical protein